MALHYFDVEVARRCGVNAAILLSDIQYWCERSKGDPAHLREGRVWMWSSWQGFAERHPYLTVRQIRYALGRLIAEEVVLTAQYSDRALDRTIWYSPADSTIMANALDNSGECIGQQCRIQKTPVANAFDKSGVSTTIHYRNTLENTLETNRVYVGGNSNVSPPDVVVRREEETITHPTIDQAREYARAAGLRVDAEAFVRVNEASGWKDTQGRPIQNWKRWLEGYALKHPASVGEEWQGHKLEFI